ncbi:hypothetical protein CWS43_20130 [Rahnella sp. AA]|uniref:hypothetical protein n=1 Tax=Rahnella sp. AA TaxID=2057180 RepID=UPI000C3484F5|nr:hypothetical protein [Rahnella sp. AA]PKE28707.1 hypothetical protein CWS43_20130 [Rahnella sp. AA]
MFWHISVWREILPLRGPFPTGFEPCGLEPSVSKISERAISPFKRIASDASSFFKLMNGKARLRTKKPLAAFRKLAE